MQKIIRLNKTKERMLFLAKTMSKPVFFILSNSKGDCLVLKNKDGAVEYCYTGEEYSLNEKDVINKKYGDIVMLLCDLKQVTGK